MINILVIKHGSLGDIAQISGAIQDIKENHPNDKIIILTTAPYEKLFLKCPYVDDICIDQRLPRWNLYYLIKLKRNVLKYNIIKIFDLQNSSRTSFYRKFLFNKIKWSSSETAISSETDKKEFDKDSVLKRFNYQLTNSNIITKNTLRPNFSWACDDISEIKNEYNLAKYILLFPFCSINLPHKKWPHYNDLILLINKKYPNLKVVIAPGPSEIKFANKINALSILENGKSLSLTKLAGLIYNAKFIVSNDTGPAHMAAHLGVSGVALFGYHTTPYKVSIETENFKAIVENDLKKLSAENVFYKISKQLSLT